MLVIFVKSVRKIFKRIFRYIVVEVIVPVVQATNILFFFSIRAFTNQIENILKILQRALKMDIVLSVRIKLGSISTKKEKHFKTNLFLPKVYLFNFCLPLTGLGLGWEVRPLVENFTIFF